LINWDFGGAGESRGSSLDFCEADVSTRAERSPLRLIPFAG
jgi:hypothetical protein